ncbi:sortase-like protein [Streptococcus suis]|nr:sortase-like protein [Streptococcus suis]
MKRIGYVFILVGLLLPLVLLTNMSVQEFQVFQQYQYYRRNSKFFSTEQLEEIKAYGEQNRLVVVTYPQLIPLQKKMIQIVPMCYLLN